MSSQAEEFKELIGFFKIEIMKSNVESTGLAVPEALFRLGTPR
jgi:hypothetical protein